jgi:hypothetical protein
LHFKSKCCVFQVENTRHQLYINPQPQINGMGTLNAQFARFNVRVGALMEAVEEDDFKSMVLGCFTSVCSKLSKEQQCEWKVIQAGFIGKIFNKTLFIKKENKKIAYVNFDKKGFMLTAVNKVVSFFYVDSTEIKSIYNVEFEKSEFIGKHKNGKGEEAISAIEKELKYISTI